MMDAQTYDWSKFEIVFYYNKPVEEVFKYWATGAGLEAFFIAKATYTSVNGIKRASTAIVEIGDHYHWAWRHPIALDGEVLNIKENKEFSFTFGNMKVSVYFSPVDHQTEVYLVQSDIPDTADGHVFGHLNCRSCWIFFLTNLTSIFETGQDLRDTNPDRASSMEVGFKPLSANS